MTNAYTGNYDKRIWSHRQLWQAHIQTTMTSAYRGNYDKRIWSHRQLWQAHMVVTQAPITTQFTISTLVIHAIHHDNTLRCDVGSWSKRQIFYVLSFEKCGSPFIEKCPYWYVEMYGSLSTLDKWSKIVKWSLPL